MEVDIRKHEPVRQAVHAGLAALRVQARQIWGRDFRQELPKIVVRLAVTVGDVARAARGTSFEGDADETADERDALRRELKKELGNVLFSTVRWIDDLGFDILECIDLAIEAQEKFAKSGRPR